MSPAPGALPASARSITHLRVMIGLRGGGPDGRNFQIDPVAGQ